MNSDIDANDPQVTGAKGLVFIGDKILVYRRDTNTTTFPLKLDLPGGGVENAETPFAAFQRELLEEFGLHVTRGQITYSRRYHSTLQRRQFGEFVVAQLPSEAEQRITFGSEGVEYMLMSIDEYLSRTDAWPVFQDRTRDYVQSLTPRP